MDPTSQEGATQTKPQPQEPVIVQLDPKCLHSALKEFLEPLRSNDPRADFFAVYRKESDEFDRDYARKYDEDLNTSLIFAGLFSAVSSAFIIDVQSKLQPDPNEMTAAYMQILIHAVNSSLFPDADPGAIAWTGPPPEIVTVQSLLYASLATSLFAAFLAFLSKQWVNRYLRNRGGSAVDKSRDRQRKLDGLQKWYFHFAIESLPVMLQLALLLLGWALSQYLWTISRTVAGVITAVTVLGFTLYVFLTLVATFCYNCPYQTPPSTSIRTVIKYLTHSDARFARSLRSLIESFPSIEHPGRILGRLRLGARSVLRNFSCVPAVGEDVEHIPLAAVVAPPTRVFENTAIDWEVCKTDVRCISWILDSTTDIDVIFSTVRFAADTIWYPEVAGALSPHILADMFFDCLLDGQVIQGRSEHASSIGMALASILSIRLCVESEDEGLRELCGRLESQVLRGDSLEPMFKLVMVVLQVVAKVPIQGGQVTGWTFPESIPNRLSTTHKLWLSRVILQTVWRWRYLLGPTEFLDLYYMEEIYRAFAAEGDQMPDILKTDLFLVSAITMGLQVDIRDLYAPNNNGALKTAVHLFHQQLESFIRAGRAGYYFPTPVSSALAHLDPFQVMGSGELGFLWITGILNSGYEDDVREQVASIVVGSLGKHLFRRDPPYPIDAQPAWISPLLRFLSLSEKLDTTRSSGLVALRILAASPGYADFGPTILPILCSALLPTHPLPARRLALTIFLKFAPGWFSSQMENISSKDLKRLVQAVGDPFQFPDLPPQDEKLVDPPDYNSTMATAVLIDLASSDPWSGHLRHSNFTSFEETVSTWDGKRTALGFIMSVVLCYLPEFLSTAAKITTAIRRLEELQCSKTVECVITWAWIIGAVDPVDHDGWKLIERDTLRFYQTRGMERLVSLKRHITDTAMDNVSFLLLYGPGRRPWSGAEIAQVLKSKPFEPYGTVVTHLHQACQLRKLYRLFRYDPVTWKEAVKAVDVYKGVGVSSGRSVTPVPFVDWACDYP